jgi:hypothetical protein
MTNENTRDYPELAEPGSFTPQSVENLLEYTDSDNETITGLDENYKLIDERTYASDITEFRNVHSDADDLFNKRDAAIEKYKEALQKNESKEHKRLTKLRLLTLNYYINRLIITYFKKAEEEQTTTDNYFQRWADTSSIKVDKDTLKQYSKSPFNDMACLFASAGIMFASDAVSQNFCVPRGPSSACDAADITNFQGRCFSDYTGIDDKGEEPHDNIGGYPQHLAWGEKERSQAKCAAGLATIGRQERGVCGLGYYMGQGPNPDSNYATGTFNYTRCHLGADDADGVGGWADIGNMNHTCAIEVGGNLLQGIDSTANYHTTNGPPDLQFGATTIESCTANSDLRNAPTGQRAKCQLGYYYKNADEIYDLPEGVSHCTQPVDIDSTNENADMVCRKQVGFGQQIPTGPPRLIPIPIIPYVIPLATYSADFGKNSGVSIDQPSQHTYGMKDMYDQGAMGCNGLNRRLTCEMGYSGGVKLDPWSSECVLRTDNMGDVCQNTYGVDWFPWPQTQSSWEQGCSQPETRTKSTCRNDDMVPVGTEFTNMAHEAGGQQCTTEGLTSTDTACAHYYGPNYAMTGRTSDVYVKYGEITTLQNNNGSSSVSGTQDTTDYTDFSVDRDKCGSVLKRPICKKVKKLSEMKNSICLWTNRSCQGQTCQERVDKLNENIGKDNLNGGEWIAMNPNNKCGAAGGINSNSCLVCTSNKLTEKYMEQESPYYAALLDTAGKVGGQPAGKNEHDGFAVKPVGTNDLFLCKHAAFWDNHYNERKCTSNITTNIKTAYEDPGMYVYVPKGSDIDTMTNHLNTYANIAGEGPSQAWLPDSSNYTWDAHYGGKYCEQINTNASEFMSCIGRQTNMPNNSYQAAGPTGIDQNYLYVTNNYNKESPLESLASVATANSNAAPHPRNPFFWHHLTQTSA